VTGKSFFQGKDHSSLEMLPGSQLLLNVVLFIREKSWDSTDSEYANNLLNLRPPSFSTFMHANYFESFPHLSSLVLEMIDHSLDRRISDHSVLSHPFLTEVEARMPLEEGRAIVREELRQVVSDRERWVWEKAIWEDYESWKEERV
jgi:hypothetical protein